MKFEKFHLGDAVFYEIADDCDTSVRISADEAKELLAQLVAEFGGAVQVEPELLPQIAKYTPDIALAVNRYALPMWLEYRKMHMADRQAKKARRAQGQYSVVPWGDCFAVVDRDNPDEPHNGTRYTEATHAHRAKRRLNKAHKDMQQIMDEHGGALIL